jgi:hypothetical protein
MCNCNQKRVAYSASKDQSKNGMVKVKLTEDNPVVFTGNITGRMYAFQNIDDIHWVDKRDVMSMNKNGLQILS